MDLRYLEDILNGNVGADLSATARIGSCWMKFRERFPFLIFRALPLEMKRRVYV